MSTQSNVRVRYAPSPTGYLHVGGVRTYLFNWLFAKRHGGKLILRIEDTDQERSRPEHEAKMMTDIRTLELDYDEGPDVGGDYGPYRQSDRLKIYFEHARKLLNEGKAYHCFCSPDELTQKRDAAMKMGRPFVYDGTCLKLPKEEIEKRLASGEKAGLRFRSPNKSFVLDDIVKGRVEFKEGTVGDFFITRSPREGEEEVAAGIGMPVYNFACVIDDHLMELTHIIRGEDHLSNTARQLMIYDAFGWELPQMAHSGMVLGTDRQKLSKRNGDVSVHDYLSKGYLPDAIINFLVLLGWWPKGDFKPKSGHPEILSREELFQIFDTNGLQKSPAIFDVQKLRWMNSFYLKSISLDEVMERSRRFFESYNEGTLKGLLEERSPEWLKEALDLVRSEVALLSELPEAIDKLFLREPEVDEKFSHVFEDPKAKEVAVIFEKKLRALHGDLTEEAVKALQKETGKDADAKGKVLFMTIRAITTGRTQGPELTKVLPLLGKDAVLGRIDALKREAAITE
jgi:nondiscriminating glutamyl-tRNA synthetase